FAVTISPEEAWRKATKPSFSRSFGPPHPALNRGNSPHRSVGKRTWGILRGVLNGGGKHGTRTVFERLGRGFNGGLLGPGRARAGPGPAEHSCPASGHGYSPHGQDAHGERMGRGVAPAGGRGFRCRQPGRPGRASP